jgi:hypothetical protein
VKAWHIILTFQSLFTFILTGIVWCIQVVNYPLLPWIDREKFCDFEKKYQSFFAILLLIVAKEGMCRILAFALFALLLFVWFSTFCLQIPQHAELAHGFSMKNIKKLILTHWIRTIAWSFRCLILLWLLIST